MRKSLAGCIADCSMPRLYRPGRRLRSRRPLFRHLRASPRSCCGAPSARGAVPAESRTDQRRTATAPPGCAAEAVIR